MWWILYTLYLIAIHISPHMYLKLFTSFTHYTSYSLLNIVHVIVCVFGLTNQVCEYFEFIYKTDLMLENWWRMFENLNFGKTGFKTCVLEKHFISFLCILLIIFNALMSFFKNQVIFSKKLFFQNFNWSNLFFDQSKLHLKFYVSFCLFQSIENRE